MTVPKRPSEDVIRENVAEVIRKYPEQRDFAQAFGVSNATVSSWLSGKRKITLSDLDRLSDMESVHPSSWLIDRNDPDKVEIPDLFTALKLIEKRLRKL